MATDFATRAARLPLELTSFVGRREEVNLAHRLLGSSRLVTLTGPGGIGKTRLSIHVASQAQRLYPAGVWFVELAHISDPRSLADEVAGALSVHVTGERSIDALTAYIGTREVLLVLDNCEHLLQACLELVSALLRRCAGIRILATSRESLGIFGESTLLVPTLAVRSADGESPSENSMSAAITLFTDRASRVVSDLDMSDENLAVIAKICCRLDGLPLAIELAAARLKALSPDQVLARLSEPNRLLTGGNRAAPERLRALAACIAWSYQLCTPDEQLLWRRLSVFPGGCELDCVEFVGRGIVSDIEVLDIVQSLVEKSIVVRNQSGGRVWYSMLETIRQFGIDELNTTGEMREARIATLGWTVELIRQNTADWVGPHQRYWLARTFQELPNIRAAVAFSIAEGDAESALRVLVPSWRTCWLAHGRLSEFVDCLDRVLALDTAETSLWSQALNLRGMLNGLLGKHELEAVYVAAAKQSALRRADKDSLALVIAAEAAALGNSQHAVALYEDALAHLTGVPHLLSRTIGIRSRLALLYDALGDQENAALQSQQVLAFGDSHGEKYECAHLLLELGMLALNRNELDAGLDLTVRSLRLSRELIDHVGAALAEQNLAYIAVSMNDPERAAGLLGAAAVLWQNSGAVPTMFLSFTDFRHACEAQCRSRLSSESYEKCYSGGQKLSMLDAIAWALKESSGVDRDDLKSSNLLQSRGLTKREREIAVLLAEGITNREISTRLFISQRTAEGHVERVLVKLGFSSRGQVTAWLIENGV